MHARPVPRMVLTWLLLLAGAGAWGCHRDEPAPPPRPVDSEVDALVAAIDENAHPLLYDRTPAAVSLIRLGRRSVPACLEVFAGAPEHVTRIRAVRVLQGVTAAEFGATHGPEWPGDEPGWYLGRWPDDESAERWARFWREAGNLKPGDPPEVRAASVARWRRLEAGQ